MRTYFRVIVLVGGISVALAPAAAQAPSAMGESAPTGGHAPHGGSGAPSTPMVYPSVKRVRTAQRWIAGRSGRKAFAVIDDEGRLHGFEIHSRFHSASVVKSMLLVAYLRKLAREHHGLDNASKGLLYPMIHSSDN
ncbi:MAG TPA: hypothetical protein VMB05_12230, partial [Solirubrobacteraceae bacterium]|nr:hypothetical protein [Solirubrobacteraceae bacterium]